MTEYVEVKHIFARNEINLQRNMWTEHVNMMLEKKKIIRMELNHGFTTKAIFC
jgi:hypothetical protein